MNKVVTMINKFYLRNNFFLIYIVNKLIVAALGLTPFKLVSVLYKVRKIASSSQKIFGSVEIVPFKYDAKGAFCISIDLELAWAWRFVESSHPYAKAPMGRYCRKNFPHILESFERYSVPATWAVIGHLFLESCKRSKNGLAHPDMPRPKGYCRDWYEDDPCTDVERDPCWYGSDLVRKIMQSKVKHEIASHSFSHVDFSNCARSVALSELRESIRAMSGFGVKPLSFVFPRGAEGHLDVISEFGIIAYRPHTYNAVSYPEKGKLWKIYQSFCLLPELFNNWPQKGKHFIDEAIENNMVCQMWFHPSQIDEKMVKENLVPILDYASKKRSEGYLWVATMSDIACYCEARENTRLNVLNESDKIQITLREEFDVHSFGHPEITVKINLRKNLPKIVYVDGKATEMHTPSCYLENDGVNFLVLTIPSNVRNIEVLKREDQNA